MGTVRKKKSGRQPWATEEQTEWLIEQKPAYITSRGTKVPGDFWPPIYEEWFEKWPITVAEFEGVIGDKQELLASGIHDKKKVSGLQGCISMILTFLWQLCSKSGIGSRTTKVRVEHPAEGNRCSTSPASA